MALKYTQEQIQALYDMGLTYVAYDQRNKEIRAAFFQEEVAYLWHNPENTDIILGFIAELQGRLGMWTVSGAHSLPPGHEHHWVPWNEDHPWQGRQCVICNETELVKE